ncbi:sodium-coupled monocarboxylate transporter 1-like [Rhincodon typus]|uniref:sodium-coupled monocarboxylate transporter 1-like n=1 Tax=Rhincodon typus TaxID=259920 RepID=UPI0020301DBE|nr:sodium-coupled monocarboxylate transporter 1-like [Rhincodon typus]
MAENHVFHAWDYVVFASMLLVSTAIGLFYAFKRGGAGQRTTEDFLVGNRQISAYPIAFSLAASFMSAVALIGYPAEVYNTGLNILMLNVARILTTITVCLVYIPLFYRLNIISTYELQSIQNLTGLIICRDHNAATCSVSISHLATELNLLLFVMSSQGGIKAVVWTDVFQLCIMMIGLLAVLIQGSIHVGSFGKIWNIAKNNGRTSLFDFDPDPRKRYTFWTVSFGALFGWTSIYGCNQVQIQRYLSCKSEKEARKAVVLNVIGTCILFTLSCLCGLVMYAVYENCDPIKANRVSTTDELTPLLVMELFDQMPGFPGLFVASAYSGTLSTISSGISALAAVCIEDLIKPTWKPWGRLSSRKKTLISKLLAMTFGLITIGLTGVSSLMGRNIIQATLTFEGIILGPILGVFTLAAIFPKSNSGSENLDPCLISPIVHTIYKYIFKTKPTPSITETNDNLIQHPVPRESSNGCDNSTVLNPIKSTKL